jgi:hypothetical protein
MYFRIGINVGDVRYGQGRRIFGDGVNVAAGWKAWPKQAAFVCCAVCAISFAAADTGLKIF